MRLPRNLRRPTAWTNTQHVDSFTMTAEEIQSCSQERTANPSGHILVAATGLAWRSQPFKQVCRRAFGEEAMAGVAILLLREVPTTAIRQLAIGAMPLGTNFSCSGRLFTCAAHMSFPSGDMNIGGAVI